MLSTGCDELGHSFASRCKLEGSSIPDPAVVAGEALSGEVLRPAQNGNGIIEDEQTHCPSFDELVEGVINSLGVHRPVVILNEPEFLGECDEVGDRDDGEKDHRFINGRM